MTKQIFIVILVFLCWISSSMPGFSQIIGESPLKMPAKFVVPLNSVSIDSSSITQPGSVWKVLSDRNSNQTYKDTLLSEPFKTIDFLSSFYVAEDRGEIIRLVKDPELEDGKFSFMAEDYGWISKRDMLLWSHCLISDNGGQNRKALVQNTLTEVKQERVEQGVTYYFNPSLRSESEKLSRSYEILYVFKEDGSSLFLGKNPSFFIDNAHENMFGWIKRNQVTEWDHNVALEVNWDKEAAEERQEKEQPAIFYLDKARAKKYSENEKIKINIEVWDKDSYDKRPEGSVLRFPFIELDTASNVLKAYVFNSEIGIMNKVGGKWNRFIGAFSPMQINGHHYPMYNFVFFLSKLELSRVTKLYIELRKIEESKYDMRTKLHDYWFGKIRNNPEFVDMSDSQIDSLSFNNVCQLLYNVESESVLSSFKLEQFGNPPYISDIIITEYFKEIAPKYEELNKIFNSNTYEYGFQSFDLYYYWIDRRLFPL